MRGKPPALSSIKHGMPVKYKSYRWTFDGEVVGAVYSDNPMKKDNITALVIKPVRYGLPRKSTFAEQCRNELTIVPLEDVRARKTH